MSAISDLSHLHSHKGRLEDRFKACGSTSRRSLVVVTSRSSCRKSQSGFRFAPRDLPPVGRESRRACKVGVMVSLPMACATARHIAVPSSHGMGRACASVRQGIDKSWEKVMVKALETRNVVQYIYGNDMLQELLPHLLEQLEVCQKALSGYLDQKRAAFPRFYFVSDAVLLESELRPQCHCNATIESCQQSPRPAINCHGCHHGAMSATGGSLLCVLMPRVAPLLPHRLRDSPLAGVQPSRHPAAPAVRICVCGARRVRPAQRAADHDALRHDGREY